MATTMESRKLSITTTTRQVDRVTPVQESTILSTHVEKKGTQSNIGQEEGTDELREERSTDRATTETRRSNTDTITITRRREGAGTRLNQQRNSKIQMKSMRKDPTAWMLTATRLFRTPQRRRSMRTPIITASMEPSHVEGIAVAVLDITVETVEGMESTVGSVVDMDSTVEDGVETMERVKSAEATEGGSHSGADTAEVMESTGIGTSSAELTSREVRRRASRR